MKGEIQPPAYFASLLILSIASHFVYPGREVVEPPYVYLGIPLIAFGVAFNFWADSLFKKGKTTVKPREMPSKLVVSGPFKISRHPMYTRDGRHPPGRVGLTGISDLLRLSPDLRDTDGGVVHPDRRE